MVLPAKLLEQIRSAGHAGQVGIAEPEEASEGGLSFGFAALDAVLPDQGMLRGGVVELSAQGKLALATQLSLLACRSAQAERVSLSGSIPWCAFIDPTGTLYAPGVLKAGVQLERLLVVRPLAEALARTAIRLVESQAFSLVVVDTVGAPGVLPPSQNLVALSHAAWPRVVRRLALAVEGSQQCVLVITDPAVPRSVIWPVAERIELSRCDAAALVVKVTKHKRGLVTGPHRLAWPALNPQKLAHTRASETPPSLRGHVRLSA
jgi:recombination protein RecA